MFVLINSHSCVPTLFHSSVVASTLVGRFLPPYEQVPVHSAAPCTIIAVTQCGLTAALAVLYHSCTPALCL